jgi:adenylate cyclase
MMRLFGHQVSPEVAAAIWRDRDAFYANGRIPERDVDVTVLFLDIRNFTTMTEQLGTRTIAWLNRGLGPMTDIVLAHGGVVTRFVGDQIMAVFGVPVPRKDTAQVRADACAAVASAVAIRDRLDRLREELAAEDLPAIRVRIGINSGRVTQGAVGSSSRFEFSVFGDAVNTAARLESVATEDDGVSARILVSESTHALCGDRFRSEPLGAFPLKGETHAVAIHRIHASLQPGSP